MTNTLTGVLLTQSSLRIFLDFIKAMRFDACPLFARFIYDENKGFTHDFLWFYHTRYKLNFDLKSIFYKAWGVPYYGVHALA